MTTPDLGSIRDRLRRSVEAQRLLRGLDARAAEDSDLESLEPLGAALSDESVESRISGLENE